MKSISQKLFVLGSAGLLLLTGCNGTETTSSTTGTETTTTTTETATSPASSPVASPVAAETASPVANSAGTETKTTTTETTTTATAPGTTGTDATTTATAPGTTGTDTAASTTTTTTTTTSNETATAAEAKKGGQAIKFANYHLELVTAPQDTGTKVDFYLLASDAGTAISDATVTATVKNPSGETKEVAMVYDTATESYTAILPDTAAGSYEVAVSSKVKDEQVQGNFTVQR